MCLIHVVRMYVNIYLELFDVKDMRYLVHLLLIGYSIVCYSY